MSGNPPGVSGWRRVTRQSPCPVCNKPDWCSVSFDGAACCCMRVASQRQLRNAGWLHMIADAPARRFLPVNVTRPALGLASLEQRDRAYRALIAELGLRPHHREQLEQARGLPGCAIVDFASTPPRAFAERRRLVLRVIERLGDSRALSGVPGFLVDRYGHWTCSAVPPGIMVPVRNPFWQIMAFQIRADHCGLGEPRYIWFSSRGKPGGSSPGAPVAYWEPGERTCDAILATEGPIKARVAGWHLQARAVGIPGVSNWSQALDLIPEDAHVIVGYDGDARTNPVVARHQLALARALYWSGRSVAIASWDPRFKGIDDALLAGARIDLKDWPGPSRSSSPRVLEKPAQEWLAGASR